MDALSGLCKGDWVFPDLQHVHAGWATVTSRILGRNGGLKQRDRWVTLRDAEAASGGRRGSLQEQGGALLQIKDEPTSRRPVAEVTMIDVRAPCVRTLPHAADAPHPRRRR